VKQLKQKKKRMQVKEFPYIINSKNRISLALKFILNKTKNKNAKKTYKTLTTELLAVANNSVVSTGKKRRLYEYAYLKKKYYYYRWF
jgi:ribosomal protein S7